LSEGKIISNTPYNGYEHLLNLFKQAQKDSSKSVGLKRTQKGTKQYISLQITIGNKRREKASNFDFTQIWIVTALDLFTEESDF
jgi:hypothetical protein